MDDTECMICLEPFSNSTIVILKCKHIYHFECLKKWINKKNSNPETNINQYKLCTICETENEILTIYNTNNLSLELDSIPNTTNTPNNNPVFSCCVIL